MTTRERLAALQLGSDCLKCGLHTSGNFYNKYGQPEPILAKLEQCEAEGKTWSGPFLKMFVSNLRFLCTRCVSELSGIEIASVPLARQPRGKAKEVRKVAMSEPDEGRRVQLFAVAAALDDDESELFLAQVVELIELYAIGGGPHPLVIGYVET